MAFHPSEVASQPMLLTQWKNTADDAPALLASEGKSGALFMSTHFITSPNCRIIPSPPPPGDCTVVLHKDGHFGIHDFGRWPQLFNPKHPHLCCIPAKPLDKTDPLRIMWHICSADDFVPSSESFFTELGKVKPTLCDSIRVHVTKLQTDFKRLDNDTRLYIRNSEGVSNRTWVDILYSQLEIWMSRVDSLVVTFLQAVFMVAELQRRWLELLAYVTYATEIRPLMIKGGIHVAPRRPFLGAFTYDLVIAEELSRAGVPVFFIRSLSMFSDIRIDAVVDLLPVDSYLRLDPVPDQKSIYQGPLSSPTKYYSILIFSRHFFSYHDEDIPSTSTVNPTTEPPPKRIKLAPNVVPSSSSSTATTSFASSSSPVMRMLPVVTGSVLPYNRRKPSQTPGFRKPTIDGTYFSPSSHDFMPPMMQAWEVALQKVDRSPSRTSTSWQVRDSGYLFPNPFIFIPSDQPSTKAIDKISSFFVTWLLYKPALILRALRSKMDSSLLISTAQWREACLAVLHHSGKLQPSQSSKTEEKLLSMAGLLHGWASKHRVRVDVKQTAAEFHGRTVELGNLPAPSCARDIIWELNELNFRHDLMALDGWLHRYEQVEDMMGRQDQAAARQALLRQCFPDTSSGGDFASVLFIQGRSGLSSRHIDQRRPFILKLATVMSTWEGIGDDIKDFVTATNTSNAVCEKVELQCAEFFCQTFTDRFGRAPCIPRYLPDP